MDLRSLRATSHTSEERKPPFVAAWAYSSPEQAQDVARELRSIGRKARVFRRTIRADNRICDVWVVIARAARPAGGAA
jgi:hypothetical protein